MPEFPYRCQKCGIKRPVDFVSESRWDADSDYPPSEIQGICGTRWGGCGDVQTLELVEADVGEFVAGVGEFVAGPFGMASASMLLLAFLALVVRDASATYAFTLLAGVISIGIILWALHFFLTDARP